MTRSSILRPSIRRTGLTLGLVVLAGAAGCQSREGPMDSEQPTPDGTVRLTPEQMSAAELAVEAASLRDVSEILEVPGSVMSPDTALAQVGSVVEGRVESVRVLPGDVVTRGQELMRISSREMTEALRDLRAAEARATYSAAALGRSQELFDAGALSREEVQRRQAQHTEVEAELARSRDRIRRLSPSQDGEVVVRAPRSGTVFQVSVKPGSAVVPGAPLVELGRTDVLWATGWVPEKEAVHLASGDSVRVRFQALPGVEASGPVVGMGGVVDPVRRAVEVRAELTTLPQGIRPGLFTTLLIPSAPPLPRAVLPAEAVQHTPSGDVVFIEEGEGLFRPRAVEVVVLPGGGLAVTGVRNGDRIVVQGAYAVRSAMEGRSLASEEES